MRPAAAIALALALVPASAVQAGIWWDNNMTANGFGLRGVSEPQFPSVRAADDFFAVGAPLEGAHFAVVEDDSWERGPLMQIFVYADSNGTPGEVVAERTGPYRAHVEGDPLFGRTQYHYWMEFRDIGLVPDETYWVGFRNPAASGSGSNYWLTSDGGPNGQRSSTGYFSLDGGNTWRNEGDDWHYAFELTGIPAPGALGVFAFSAALGRRRRRA